MAVDPAMVVPPVNVRSSSGEGAMRLRYERGGGPPKDFNFGEIPPNFPKYRLYWWVPKKTYANQIFQLNLATRRNKVPQGTKWYSRWPDHHIKPPKP
jgi:hypothetical protein